MGPAARELAAANPMDTRGWWGSGAPVVFRPGPVGACPVGGPGLEGKEVPGDRRRPR